MSATSGLSLLPPSKDSLAIDARTWSDRAADLTITNDEVYTNAGWLARSIKGVINDIDRWFAPHVEAAMETKRKAEDARKKLADERDRMKAPLEQAEKDIKRKLIAYSDKKERERIEQELRQQAEARRKAEELTLAVAADLEMQASLTGDEEMRVEAEDILAQPIDAPVVAVRSTTPKLAGVSKPSDNWKAHPSVDVKALALAVGLGKHPITFLLPNMTALNAYGRSTKGTAAVAGVKFWNDRNVAVKE